MNYVWTGPATPGAESNPAALLPSTASLSPRRSPPSLRVAKLFNHRLFCDLVEDRAEPVGLLAYRDGEVVGWCAAGPRSRYVRALRTPTFKGHDPAEDETVWLVPCFYVRREARREGVIRALLEGAVDLARKHEATAIEGFPFASGAKRSKDIMVGLEPLFASCGFSATRRPSPARVVMRRQLDG